MNTGQSHAISRKRVAQGLYRSSASQVYFAHVRINGKLFRESLETTDRKLAERKLANFRRAKEKIDPQLSKTTIGELCDRYGETLAQLAKSSQQAKKGILARIKSDWPGGPQQSVADIKPSDCDRWLAMQAPRLGRSHFNAYIQVLRDLLSFAARDRMIAENPTDHLKYLKRERPIRLAPSWEEFHAIVEEIRKQPLNALGQQSADFVEFMGLAGLGQAEASTLTWDHVDFERGQMTAFRHKTRTGFSVPIFRQLRPFLNRLSAKRAGGAGEKVFQIHDAKKALTGACQRLGLPHYTSRSLRRMFVTRALEKGINAKVVSQWQGHRDGGKLILDTYSHVNPAHSQDMAQLMGDKEPDNVVSMDAAMV